MSKEEWKSVGKNMGQAFAGLGKAVVRSADRVIDIVQDDNNDPNIVDEPNSTVFSDGTWKKTWKDLGKSLVDAGEATANTISDALK